MDSAQSPFPIEGVEHHPWTEAYLHHIISVNGLSANTVSAYSQDLQDLVRFLDLHDADLGQVSEQTLVLYFIFLRRQGLSNRSLARRLSSLRSFFDYLCDENHLQDNPARLLDGPKLPQVLPRVLNESEMASLLAAPNPRTKLGSRDGTILELMYAAGLRVSEVCSLRPLDYDAQTGFLRVSGKGSKERILPVHAAAQSRLSSYITSWRPLFGPKTEAMFLNRSGTGLSRQGLWKMIVKYARQAGINPETALQETNAKFTRRFQHVEDRLRDGEVTIDEGDLETAERLWREAKEREG